MNALVRQHSSRQRGGLSLSMLFVFALVLMAAAFMFGGASRLHAVPLTIVELASIPALVAALFRFTNGGRRNLVVAYGLLAAAIALPLLQLVPLPYSVWANLPGREPAAVAAQLADVASGWRPFSLTPQETWKAALALLPPVAMFLATVNMASRERLLVAGLAVLFALANLTIGLAQLTTGVNSPFYVYDNSSRGAATGLFANRNHYAITLVTILPLVALWLKSFDSRRTGRLLIAVGGLAFVAILIVGVIMGRSRAAAVLLLPSLLGAAFVVWKGAGPRMSRRVAWAVGAAFIVVAALALGFGLEPLMLRFSEGVTNDVRFAAAPAIWQNSLNFLPFGSGIGSFEQIYHSFESPDLMSGEFLNHAHDDYLEIWLETGVLGAAIFVGFALWWTGNVVRAFKATGVYADLARAGAIATAILLVHSLVDYPLRTPALATLFAFACALVATPEPPDRTRKGVSATAVEDA